MFEQSKLYGAQLYVYNKLKDIITNSHVGCMRRWWRRRRTEHDIFVKSSVLCVSELLRYILFCPIRNSSRKYI